MATVADLIERGVRRMGGRTGEILSGSTTTQVILGGLVGISNDDTQFQNALLFMPDGAAGDQERFISSWDAETGTATVATLSGAPAAGDRYAVSLAGDYTLTEYVDALNKALRYSRRTYRYVLPTTPLLELNPLDELDWLEGSGSIDAVWWSDSPLMLHNEDFFLWQDGASAAPDGYTLAGSGATVSRQPGGLRSAFQARLTRVGNDATLYQSIPQRLTQWLTRRSFPIFTPMRAAGWVTCDTASVARIGIYDGLTTTWSGYHTGSGVPEYLSTSLTPTATMTDFRWVAQVANQDASADFSAAVLMQNTLDAVQAYQVRDQGSQAYVERPYTNAVRNVGASVPTVDLRGWPGTYGQLIIYSRRPHPEVSSLDDVIEDQEARAFEAGMLVFALDNVKPGQDRTRLDYVLNGDPGRNNGERGRWTAFLQQAVDIPVAKPMNWNLVVGA